jgi:hypothetical protein
MKGSIAGNTPLSVNESGLVPDMPAIVSFASRPLR